MEAVLELRRKGYSSGDDERAAGSNSERASRLAGAADGGMRGASVVVRASELSAVGPASSAPQKQTLRAVGPAPAVAKGATVMQRAGGPSPYQ